MRVAVVLSVLLATGCVALMKSMSRRRDEPLPGAPSLEHSLEETEAELVPAAPAGGAVQRHPVPAGETRGNRVELEKGGITLAGRVLDEQGLPVEGLVIAAEVFETFPGSATGRWKSPDEATERRTDPDGCFVSVHVLDEQGRAAPGVRIWIEGRDLFQAGHETGPEGRLEAGGLPPESVVVKAFRDHVRDEWLQARVQLVAGEPASVELQFEPRATRFVHGKVVRGGRPIAVEILFASGPFTASSSSSADGRFEVELQRPGAWRGAVWSGTGQPNPETDDVRLFDASIPFGGDFSLNLIFESLPRLKSFEELRRR
jgi:hypothetical protein